MDKNGVQSDFLCAKSMVVLGITAAGYLVTQGPSTVVMTSRSRRIIMFGCVRFEGAPPNTVLRMGKNGRCGGGK
jgi:hypothetical protein